MVISGWQISTTLSTVGGNGKPPIGPLWFQFSALQMHSFL